MKRVLYILAVLAVSLLLVGSMLVAVLMSDRVETAAVRLVTAELSRALGTHAQVGSVEYRFPARLKVHDVLIEDQQRDTLAYIGEAYAHFRPLGLTRNEIAFSHVRLTDVVAKAYRLPDSTFNYTFLAEAFRGDTTQENAPFRSLLSVRDIRLNNIRLEYEDYRLVLLYARMDVHHFSEDALDAQISELAATISKPQSAKSRTRNPIFEVEDLKAHLIFNDTILALPTLSARLPRSAVDLGGVEVRFPAGDTLYLSRSAHEITFALDFHEAEMVLADLAFFLPRFAHLDRPISLHGHLGGTLDSVTIRDIEMRYNNELILSGDVGAVGLPDLKNPYVRANLKEARTNAAQLQDFLSRLYNRPIQLPQAVHRLGTIRYRGLAEGRLQDLTLHGAFSTALGSISTDGAFRSDSLFQHMEYDAQVVGRKFLLGHMVGHEPLKSLTLDVRSVGRIDEGIVRGDVNAHISDLTYDDYTYSDIHLNGRYDPKRYQGTCSVRDPRLTVSFDGVVDMQDVNPEINFNLRCDQARFGDLRTSFALAADLDGADLDRMSGYMVLDSFFIATRHDSLLMRQLTLLVSADAPSRSSSRPKSITVRSDYLNAAIEGSFRYADIVPAAQAMIHYYLPTAIEEPASDWQPVSFTFQLDGQRLRDIQRLYDAPVTLSDHPALHAEADIRPDEEPSFNLRFTAPGIRAGSTPVHDLTMDMKTLRESLGLSISAEAMDMQTVLSTLAFRDTVVTHLTLRSEAHMDELLPEGWRDLSPRALQRALSPDLTFQERQRALLAAQRSGDYGGDIKTITHFDRYDDKPLIDVHVMPSTLLLRDSLYTIGESRLTYAVADTSLQVDHFLFEGGGQHLMANGLASRRTKDTLSVDLQRVDASYVVPFVLPVQTIMFNGLLTGKAKIASVFKRPNIDTQIHIDSMGLNNCYFGEADVALNIYDSLAFHADVYRPTRKVVNLDGKALFDGSGRWELDMDADSVPLAFINHWTSSVLRDLDGNATGKVIVGGRKGLTYVLLNAAAQDASLTLPWTGARYTIPHDTIVMDTTSIEFPHVHLQDAEGNPVEVYGAIYHDQFKDFKLDLHVDAHEALVFDSEKKGEMLQGHVYANGHVDVTGTEQDLLVAADAVTTKNSQFRLSVDNVSSAYESNFINFVTLRDSLEARGLLKREEDHSGESDLDNIDNAPVRTKDDAEEKIMRAGRCLIKLNLEVNPQLQFQLVLGERNGDRIMARGSGALQLAYDTETGDVRLLGTYDIEQGTLSYTIANVIRKEFVVGEGSTIVFSGNASNPQLDVTAKYRVTANLRDLFGEDADQLATSRSNIPVLTCLHLTGQLSNPILSFSLEFPQSDQSIQAQVKQIINTDEMLMRQVIYLLVFGRFFTPDYMTMSQSTTTLNSTYSLLSSTITSQINSWLSKLTDVVTLGVAIRSDGEGTNSSEYEAQFQIQPVDRLVINGNVGYRYNDVSNQPFFGDLDVEVLLTEDGQWRLKGYTHTVDKYSLRQASTIQGIGFMWKKDFNWPATKRKDKEFIEQRLDSIQHVDSIK